MAASHSGADSASVDGSFAKLSCLAATSRERPVWLRVGRLVDGTSEAPLVDAHLVFDAEQVAYVGSGAAPPPAELVRQERREPDLVLDGWTALPCLIEAHAHLFLEGAPIGARTRAAYLEQPADAMLAGAWKRLPRLLEYGIGAVRDAGDKHGVGLSLAADAKQTLAGLAPAPWIDSPGAAIHHRGRYGSFMGEPIEDHAGPAECVAARVAAGADRIKLLVSGIINFDAGRVTAKPQMPPDEVRQLVQAAQAHGRQTFAHASGADGVENSIEGGVTTVEHGFFVTDEQLARMRDRGIGWVPTFAPVQLQIDRAAEIGWSEKIADGLRRIIDGHRRSLAKAHDMGVRIVAGSDAGSCGVAHGLGFLEELVHMERSGVPPAAVLLAATGRSAEALAFPQPIGRIAAGYRSRMILTPHDPLATVANLMCDKVILFDGRAIRGNRNDQVDGM